MAIQSCFWLFYVEGTLVERTKAYRRHQREKYFNKAKTILTQIWGFEVSTGLSELDIQYRLNRLHKNRAPCSRWCCGNPRKHFNEKTRQEIKQEGIKCEL